MYRNIKVTIMKYHVRSSLTHKSDMLHQTVISRQKSDQWNSCIGWDWLQLGSAHQIDDEAHQAQQWRTHERPAARSRQDDGHESTQGTTACMECMEHSSQSKTMQWHINNIYQFKCSLIVID